MEFKIRFTSDKLNLPRQSKPEMPYGGLNFALKLYIFLSLYTIYITHTEIIIKHNSGLFKYKLWRLSISFYTAITDLKL